MKNAVKINSVELINADSLQYVATLLGSSIDLIITGPPYFKVKPNDWDNQWKRDDDYSHWLSSCLAEYARILKLAGSIYLFYGHRLTPDIETMMYARFNVLNHIIWAKPSGRWDGCNKKSLRVCFPSTERILFTEHYLRPHTGKEDVYERKSTELKQHVMTLLIGYFRNTHKSLGVSLKEIAEVTEKKDMALHWFGTSQWRLSDEVNHRKLQELFTRIAIGRHIQQELEHPHHQLVITYQSLNRKYSKLLEEYKTLRRRFSVSVLVPYIDVWTHGPVQFYPGRHPCEKPVDMLKQIVSVSSRPGDIVTDLLMGSGPIMKAAIEPGRRAIEVELEADRFIQTTGEVEKLSKT